MQCLRPLSHSGAHLNKMSEGKALQIYCIRMTSSYIERERPLKSKRSLVVNAFCLRLCVYLRGLPVCVQRIQILYSLHPTQWLFLKHKDAQNIDFFPDKKRPSQCFCKVVTTRDHNRQREHDSTVSCSCSILWSGDNQTIRESNHLHLFCGCVEWLMLLPVIFRVNGELIALFVQLKFLSLSISMLGT